jgi:hypothetical protein
MTIVKNNTPILKRDGTVASDHVIRVYRRDTGAFLTETLTANALGIFKSAGWTGDRNSGGWDGLTLRSVVDKSLLQPGNRIRLTFRAATNGPSIISSVHIGEANPSGTAYDFTSATPVLFGGLSGITVATDTEVLSDWTSFVYTGNSNLVISVYYVGSDNVRAVLGATAPQWSGYYATGNFSNTLGVSGFTTGVNVYSVRLVEINDTTVQPGHYIAYCGSYSGDTNVICLDQTGTANDLILRSSTI